MRREISLYIALACLGLAILLVTATPGLPQTITNAVTATMVRTRDWVTSGGWTFGKPIAFTTTTATAPSTGLKFNADTNSLDFYKSGSLGAQHRTNEWIPPDCDADGPDTFGGICKNTTDGKVYIRDAGGLREL